MTNQKPRLPINCYRELRLVHDSSLDIVGSFRSGWLLRIRGSWVRKAAVWIQFNLQTRFQILQLALSPLLGQLRIFWGQFRNRLEQAQPPWKFQTNLFFEIQTLQLALSPPRAATNILRPDSEPPGAGFGTASGRRIIRVRSLKHATKQNNYAWHTLVTFWFPAPKLMCADRSSAMHLDWHAAEQLHRTASWKSGCWSMPDGSLSNQQCIL